MFALIWLICIPIAGALYRATGRSFAVGALAGLVLGPLGVIVALCSSKVEAQHG